VTLSNLQQPLRCLFLGGRAPGRRLRRIARGAHGRSHNLLKNKNLVVKLSPLSKRRRAAGAVWYGVLYERSESFLATAFHPLEAGNDRRISP
jgi:hypothetical protein